MKSFNTIRFATGSSTESVESHLPCLLARRSVSKPWNSHVVENGASIRRTPGKCNAPYPVAMSQLDFAAVGLTSTPKLVGDPPCDAPLNITLRYDMPPHKGMAMAP